MAISIIVSDSLLTLIIEVDTGHIPANLQRVLSRNNYLCLLLFFALLFMIKWVGSIYKKNLELLEENRQRRVEQQQFELFASTTQALREWKHDYKNNLSVVCLLLADDNTERARTYLEELLHTVPEHSFQVSSGNSVLDAIVSTKLSVAKKENIDFQYNIFIPEAMPLSAIDFSTIMGNLLDNALEACTHVEKSAKPYVSLTTKTYMDMFYIQIRNSSCGKYSYNSLGELLSVKEEQGHGIGVRRIRQVVEKYNGVFQQNPEADKFTITLMIPFVSSANKQAESDD